MSNSNNKRERRPSHEFLSELSIGQKMRLTTEKQQLKVKLDKLDNQRRRSINVMDTESRVIKSTLMQQRQQQYQRLREEQYKKKCSELPEDNEDVPVNRNLVPARSVSVELTPSPRKRPPAIRNQAKSANVLRRRNSEFGDVEKNGNDTSTETVIAPTGQRRHSETFDNQLRFTGCRPVVKRFSFSQTQDQEAAVAPLRLPLADLPSRRMSMPVLFPNLNARASPRIRMTRTFDDKDTPRPAERKSSLSVNQLRMPRRHSFKREPEVSKIAGMHDVMQRTSIFQIQENEARERAAEAEVVNPLC